ncbi:MAG: transposase, partial [Fidelibacterota bacterium]
MKKKINNPVKRYHDTVVYSITSNVANRRTFFKQMIWCNMWIEVLRVTKLKYQFMLYAFCLNYDHFHILIFPDNAIGNCSQILQFLKRNTSRNINKILGYDKINLCNAEGISNCRIDDRNDNGNCRLQSGELMSDPSSQKTIDDISQCRRKTNPNQTVDDISQCRVGS